jgi:ABC-type transport system substrate-binding protein
LVRRPRRVRLLGLVAVVVLVLAACSSGSDDGSDDDEGSAPQAGVLRMGMVGPLEFDPNLVVVGQDDLIVIDLLFETLPEIDEPEVDDELRVWTYDLDGESFSDGTPVTAQDVKFSLERAAEPGEQSLRGARLDVIEGYQSFVARTATEIEGIRVVDDNTVEITTDEPYGELDRLLVSPSFAVLPAKLVSEDAVYWRQPIGSGPFELTEVTDEGATFVRAETSGAKLDGIDVSYYESVDESYAAFADGRVDWSEVPVGEYDAAAEAYGDEQFVPLNVEFWFGMNLRNPKFENQLFREAIIHAIDRPALVDEFYPGSLLLDGVVPRGVPGAQDNACGDRCVYVPDLSEDLLVDAFPDGDVPTVMIDYNEDDFEQAAAEMIAADLDAVGIPNELRPHPLSEYREFVVSSEQEFFSFGWIGVGLTPDTYLAPLFLSDSPDNVTGYNLGFADAGIAAARALATEDERLAGYQEVERAIVGQVPLVPLVQLQSHAVVSERVRDLTTRVNGTIDAEVVTVE